MAARKTSTKHVVVAVAAQGERMEETIKTVSQRLQEMEIRLHALLEESLSTFVRDALQQG